MTCMAEKLLFHLFLPPTPVEARSSAHQGPHKRVLGPSSQEEGFLAFLVIVREGLGSARGPAAELPVGALPWVLECSAGISYLIL